MCVTGREEACEVGADGRARAGFCRRPSLSRFLLNHRVGERTG